MQQRCFLGTLAFGPAASRMTTSLSSGGYVDVATGTKYPPILASLPDVDRELDISISGSSMTQSFGQLTVNLSDGVADSMNVRNHMPVFWRVCGCCHRHEISAHSGQPS
ncbi:hypothetical protein [Acetobacter pasteurianus]|uniref:hypothetical protein n=1 Tax=Acetobacter pasteurianus TaxID=438 RepID=UPI0012D725CF|nr:hypothetical protein [Acetobacter pasteurianus]